MDYELDFYSVDENDYEYDDYEEYDDDDDTSSIDPQELEWPTVQVIRPPIKSLIKSYFPPIEAPAPLDPALIELHARFQDQKEAANQAVILASATVKKLATELNTSDKPVFSWQKNKNKLTDRLKKELATATAELETAKKAHSTIAKVSESLELVVSGHEEIMRHYKNYLEWKELVNKN